MSTAINSTVPTAPTLLQRIQGVIRTSPYLLALLLLVIAVGINYSFQNNLFELRILNNNLRVFLPLMILVVGQTIVIIGGGIDLSVGTVVSLVNSILVTLIVPESTPAEIAFGVVVAVGAGVLVGDGLERPQAAATRANTASARIVLDRMEASSFGEDGRQYSRR